MWFILKVNRNICVNIVKKRYLFLSPLLDDNNNSSANLFLYKINTFKLIIIQLIKNKNIIKSMDHQIFLQMNIQHVYFMR